MKEANSQDGCQELRLDTMQQDLLQELVNIGLGRAAGALNQMTNTHVDLEAPSVRLVKLSVLQRLARLREQEGLDVVRLSFSGAIHGGAGLIFTAESGASLLRLLFAGRMEEEQMADYRSDAIREVGNVVLIWTMGAIGNAIDSYFEYSKVEYLTSLGELLTQDVPAANALVIRAAFRMQGKVVEGNIILFFDGRHCESLLQAVDAIIESSL